MTRRLSRTERNCLDAMLNCPKPDTADKLDAGISVLMAYGWMRSDAEREARALWAETETHMGG